MEAISVSYVEFRKRKFSWNMVIGSTVISSLVAVIACTSQAKDQKSNIVHKAPPRPGVEAKILGQEISLEELIGENQLEYYEKLKDLYEWKVRRVKEVR